MASQCAGSYVCQNCSKTFNRRSELTRHGKYLVGCSSCPEVYCSLKRLRQHYNLTHKESVERKCYNCEKVFKRKPGFQNHLKNIKSCKECGQRYCSLNQFNRHRVIVHGLKCEYCKTCYDSQYPTQRRCEGIAFQLHRKRIIICQKCFEEKWDAKTLPSKKF